jgi:hypothetical protein
MRPTKVFVIPSCIAADDAAGTEATVKNFATASLHDVTANNHLDHFSMTAAQRRQIVCEWP